MVTVVVKNEIKELQKLYDATEEIAAEHGISEAVLNDLQVCLDEVFSNIVNYAYPPEEKGKYNIEMQLAFDEKERKIKIALVDTGKEFNPLEASTPDLGLDLLEREIGGLGIFIVSNLMNSVEYSRLDNKNKLEMVKEIE